MKIKYIYVKKNHNSREDSLHITFHMKSITYLNKLT